MYADCIGKEPANKNDLIRCASFDIKKNQFINLMTKS